MNLSEPFVRRPVMTVVLTVSAILFGVLCYFQLPVNDLPTVDYPVIQVDVDYPGASPETMAANVATPLERQFMQINGLELVTSKSTQGHAQLTLQFNLSKSLVHSVQYVGGLNDDLIKHVGISVLNELSEQTATSRLVAEMSSLMLATRLIQNYVDQDLIDRIVRGPARLDHVRTRRVLDYIDQHLEDDLTISELAQVAHLSEFHFARVFATTMGMPPQRYVSQRRLAAAKKMISVGKLPLSEIAFRSGFSSQASFTRAFRRVTNMTPGEFRYYTR